MSQYPGSPYPGSAPDPQYSQYSASSAGWPANGYDPAPAGGQPSQHPSAAPFQAPADGYPGAVSQPTPSRSLAAPTALAAAGLAIVLLAVIGGIGSAVTRGQFNATVTSLPDDQAATVELDKGSSYGLFYSDGDDAPDCSVTSPDGDDVATKSTSSSTKVKGGKLFTTFSSKESGSYTVDCNNTSGVSVGEIVAPSSAKSTLLSLFGLVGSIIIAVIGIGMGAGGMAWRSKLAASGAASSPAAAGGSFNAMAGDPMAGAAPGAPGVYTQGAWQAGQQAQGGQYAQQPQPEQPSVFTQPVQPGQYNQQGQPGQQGYNQQGQYNGGWPAQ